MLIMLIIQVCFKCAVFQSEIKLVTHCCIRLLYLRIIHLILQAASGPSLICDFSSESGGRDEEKEECYTNGPRHWGISLR